MYDSDSRIRTTVYRYWLNKIFHPREINTIRVGIPIFPIPLKKNEIVTILGRIDVRDMHLYFAFFLQSNTFKSSELDCGGRKKKKKADRTDEALR